MILNNNFTGSMYGVKQYYFIWWILFSFPIYLNKIQHKLELLIRQYSLLESELLHQILIL